MTASKVLVVLPTLGDRLDTLHETLDSVEAQRRDTRIGERLSSSAHQAADSYGAALVPVLQRQASWLTE